MSKRARERANSRPWEQQDEDTGDWFDGAGEPVDEQDEDDADAR